MRDYTIDSDKGIKAVDTFTNYLDKINHKWRPADYNEQQRGIDIVCTAQCYHYEVKHQLWSGKLCIEESDGLREGWIYTSESDAIVWVSNDLKRLTSIKTEALREIYLKIRGNYPLRYNEETEGVHGQVWQGSFRVIPVIDIEPYLQVIKIKL